MDYKRFEWLLEKLDLVYHSIPKLVGNSHLFLLKFYRFFSQVLTNKSVSSLNSSPIVPVTKKDSVLKLTKIYCDNIRKKHLEDYKQELEKEKLVFDQEKKEIQKWIEEEEKVLGLKQ